MSEFTYAYTGSEMIAAREEAMRLVKAIQTTLETMDSELKSKLASWTGDAQASYQAAYLQAKGVADNLPVTLNAAADTLGEVNDNLDFAERSVAGTFS